MHGGIYGLVLLWVGLQLLSARTAYSQSVPAVQPFTVSGRVINGMTGAVIPRALVTLDNRNALTNALGVFSFPQFSAPSGSIAATKPGFAQSRFPSGLGVDRQLVDTTASLELKLFPDALITGSVVGSDGLPLERVTVTLQSRLSTQGTSVLYSIGAVQTDSHGGYRFEEPPGEYRLQLAYSPRVGVAGEVMLPYNYPEQGAEEKAATLRAEAGQESRIVLRPRIAKSFEVPLKVVWSGAERGAGGQNPRILVKTTEGLVFSLTPQSVAGGAPAIRLPTGTYHLHAQLQDRNSLEEAEAQVTVSERASAAVELRFSPQPQLAVELTVSASGNGTAAPVPPPSLAQLNLRLEQVDGLGDSFTGTVPLSPGSHAAPGMVTAVSAGRYRLRSGSSNWFVQAASYGTVDLLVSPMNIGSSGASEPIRLVCSNQQGTISGSVRANGLASSGWLYFIAREPSLVPLEMMRSNSGTYQRMLPPGKYTVLALDRPYGGDLTSTALLEKMRDASTIDITSGETTTHDLTLQTAESLQ